MKLAASHELFAYWNALRGARGAPERNDIEPGAIRGVLADTFILEYCLKDGFPFRVVGGRTGALFGRELRGEAFLSLWRREDAADVGRVIASAADGAQPFLIGARAAPEGAEGAEALELEVLLLPLRHHGATHARMLGSCTPSAGAYWFGLLPSRPLSLVSLRALDADPPAGFLGRAREGVRRRGHLFVYTSQD